MLGFGDKHAHSIDPTVLPVFVHALQSVEAFELAGKVWENNGRYLMADPANNKEMMRFTFSQPPCVAWLQRDKGRTDTFELILLWDITEVNKEPITEVYTISALAGQPVGDDTRAKDLLSAILTSPSIVAVGEQKQ